MILLKQRWRIYKLGPDVNISVNPCHLQMWDYVQTERGECLEKTFICNCHYSQQKPGWRASSACLTRRFSAGAVIMDHCRFLPAATFKICPLLVSNARHIAHTYQAHCMRAAPGAGVCWRPAPISHISTTSAAPCQLVLEKVPSEGS